MNNIPADIFCLLFQSRIEEKWGWKFACKLRAVCKNWGTIIFQDLIMKPNFSLDISNSVTFVRRLPAFKKVKILNLQNARIGGDDLSHLKFAERLCLADNPRITDTDLLYLENVEYLDIRNTMAIGSNLRCLPKLKVVIITITKELARKINCNKDTYLDFSPAPNWKTYQHIEEICIYNKPNHSLNNIVNNLFY